jgi:hypothetical protein
MQRTLTFSVAHRCRHPKACTWKIPADCSAALVLLASSDFLACSLIDPLWPLSSSVPNCLSVIARGKLDAQRIAPVLTAVGVTSVTIDVLA